jgi:hypothetical protein
VQRVKCDVSAALYEKVYYGPDREKLTWMQNWTAKADLTLEANESGGVTPNIAFFQPLRNAFFLGTGPSSINTATGAVTNTVSATAQNFTLGIGATYNGEVIRTETLSFTVSLAELKNWKEHSSRSQYCAPAGTTDLEAGLDLKSWLDEALKPAILGDLKTGIHPDPGSAKSSASVSASPSAKPSKAALAAQKLPPVTLSPEAKARRDLQLAIALTALGIPYNLDQFSSGNDASFCTTTYTKTLPRVPLVTYKPPAFQAPSPTNPSLEMQAATAAQDGYTAANQVSSSPLLRRGIKAQANDAARTAAAYAINVKRAAPLAERFIKDYCNKNGVPYLKPNGICDVASITLTIGGTITVADTVTISVKLPDGSQSVKYQVQAGDTTTTIATKLTAAVNADPTISGAGLGATSTINAITLTYPATLSRDSITASTSSGGTETVTPSQNAPESYVVIPLSPQFCNAAEYDQYLNQFNHDQLNPAETLVGYAQTNATLAKALLTPDQPIESIGQSMNFVVTVGLSTTPNWSLLHWKGPANGSSLASISGIRTHTLNIAMGAPTASGVTEVQRVLDNAATRQAIQELLQ